jgi:glucose/arabinose dehydrogenase
VRRLHEKRRQGAPMIDSIRVALPRLALLVIYAVAGQNSAIAAPDTIPTLSTVVKIEPLAKLDNPWGMAFLPDGRLLITEKPGRLRIYADGKLSPPIPGVPVVEHNDQGGLLDVAVDPDFARNKLVYLSFTEAAEEQPKDARIVPDPRLGEFVDKTDTVLKGTAVTRGRLDGDELKDVSVIWRQTPKIVGLNHFGGRLVFAPDGKLFITSGDRQSFDPAQDLASNLGKVVRINPDGTIPEDNPFQNKSGARADIWTAGHRNPLGAAIRPTSGELWVHEMGPKGGDEINLIEKGKNYGWPIVSKGDHYDDTAIPRHASKPEFAPPAKSWNPSISPSGIIFYDGPIASWRGSALMGGLSSKALIRLSLDGDKVIGEERIDVNRRIRDIIQSSDGRVFLLSDGIGGELLRLTPTDAASD